MHRYILNCGLAIFMVAFMVSCATVESKFNGVRKKDSIAAYEDFIKKYPDSPLASEAKKRIMELAYEQARKRDTVSAYEDFIKKYPTSPFFAAAQRRIIELDYDHVKKQDLVSTYESFIKRYPNSHFTAEAQKRIEEIGREATLADELEAALASGKIRSDKYLDINVDNIIPRLEKAIIAHIKRDGIGNRFVLKGIVPGGGVFGHFTFKQIADSDFQYIREFAEDGTLIRVAGSTFYLETGKPFDSKMSYRGISNMLPFDEGSVSRFEGKVSFGGCTFMGYTSEFNRLTFAFIKDLGYVYLRGYGRVIVPHLGVDKDF